MSSSAAPGQTANGPMQWLESATANNPFMQVVNPQGAQAAGQAAQQQKSTPAGNPYSANYDKAAANQEASSQANTNAQTQSNRPDQNTPWASEGWTQGPDGKWTQSTSLNGALGGTAQNLQGQMLTNSQTPMDNGTASGEKAFRAALDQSDRALNPQWAEASQQEASQLANEGLAPGSAAYDSAMSDFSASKNNAYQGAENNAVQQGNAEQAQTFGQNMEARQMPEQMLQGLQGFMQMPGFNAANSAETQQFLPAQQLGDMLGLQGWEAQNGQNAGTAQGGGDILKMLTSFL